MYALILISTLTNLSEIRALVYPYKEDISLVCEILGALAILVAFVGYLFRNLIKKTIIRKKHSTPRDTETLVEYNKYFTEKELEKLNVPYVQRIENNIKRNVIEEATDFLKSSEQVLIIAGESGIGKTRLAIEISKRINESSKLTGYFKFKGKCLFANLRHYKNPKDIEEKLNTELSEKTVLIFDDYQYNMEVFNEIKNNAFKRNSKLIITARPIFVEALKEKIGAASIRYLKLERMDISGILQDMEDGDLKEGIERISEGNPAIAFLALDYIKQLPDRSTKEIFQGIRTSEEFFDKIIRDFQKEYGEDFIKFLAGGELTDGITDIPQKYEKIIIEMEKGGHISRHESKYHLTPDVLSEYLINREFFTGTILKHSFEELAKAENGAYIPEILNSIIKLKDDREIYRKAAEKLLEIVDNIEPDAEQKKRRIKTGITVYDGFGNLNLVTERLGEFWTDCETLDDGNNLQDLGIFLIRISKPYEARKCLEKAKEIFTRNHDNVGISSTSHNLGTIHQNQGNYEEAVKKYNQSLKIEEELGDKSGIAYSLHQLGMIHQDQGNYEEAVKKYNQSLKIKEELGDKSGIASTMGQLGRVKEDNEEYVEALKYYFTAFSIFKDLNSPYMQLALKYMNGLKEKMGEEQFKEVYQELESGKERF
jgi:tetratricopeptide (TPR) repeat protein